MNVQVDLKEGALSKIWHPLEVKLLFQVLVRLYGICIMNLMRTSIFDTLLEERRLKQMHRTSLFFQFLY